MTPTWNDPFLAVIDAVKNMGLLQPPPNTRRDEKYYEDQSERDLLIRLSVQMEHVKRTVNWLVVAVGLVLAGVVPFSLVLAFYAAVLWVLWTA